MNALNGQRTAVHALRVLRLGDARTLGGGYIFSSFKQLLRQKNSLLPGWGARQERLFCSGLTNRDSDSREVLFQLYSRYGEQFTGFRVLSYKLARF